MTDPEEQQKVKQNTNLAKYTGIGFQMLATIGIFTLIGYKIDENSNSKRPLFTALFSLFGVIISLVQVVRSLQKKDK